MAHLWIAKNEGWQAQPLERGPFPLPPGTDLCPVRDKKRAVRGTGARADTAAMVCCGTGAGEAWHLLTPPGGGVKVNGERVALGIRALQDRDEIRVPGEAPVYFSNEKLVSIEPFSGSAEGTCPRCTKNIAANSPAVRCGSCGTWYHQAEDRQCFSYRESSICVLCGAETAVSDQFKWTPAED